MPDFHEVAQPPVFPNVCEVGLSCLWPCSSCLPPSDADADADADEQDTDEPSSDDDSPQPTAELPPLAASDIPF